MSRLLAVVKYLALTAGALIVAWVCWSSYRYILGPQQRSHTVPVVKKLGLGVWTYHDNKDHFPPADGHLSWRAGVLPYLGEADLAARLDPRQPWDAPANRPFADVRVAALASPLDPEHTTAARVRVFTGPDTLFPPGRRPLAPREVLDGLSNTILLVESEDLVPWPAPWELPYRPAAPLPPLGHPDRVGRDVPVCMADGSVRFVTRYTGEARLRAAITPAGGDGGLDPPAPAGPAAPPAVQPPPPPRPEPP